MSKTSQENKAKKAEQKSGVEVQSQELEQKAVLSAEASAKVDPRGLEPLTFPMPWGRATNYAMGP